MASPTKILCCYARKDGAFLDRLKLHLRPLQHQGLISLWADTEISSGSEWQKEIYKHLNMAKIILLLISPDFIATDYCYSIEMRQTIERHIRGEAHVVPIILRPTDWQGTPFSKLQALPTNGQPITSWADPSEAFLEVAEAIRRSVEEIATPPRSIEFSIQQGDVTTFQADVLALKYAQEFYGAAEVVAQLLNLVGIELDSLRPAVGKYRYIESQKCIQADHTLFVGVPDIINFNYSDIQIFASNVLSILALIAPTTKHLAMTIHGAGFGLDEVEAFLAQINGYVQALQSMQFPTNLEKITIIDIDKERVQRLQQDFKENFANVGFISNTRNSWNYPIKKIESYSSFSFNGWAGAIPQITGNILTANILTGNTANILTGNIPVIGAIRGNIPKVIGAKAEAKPHVFVAMPFKKEMDDVFYYGISQPVRSLGFTCERVDQEAFIGDIMEQVKRKIETAAIIIAELSGANPNVYLELGYAWGKGRPTILLLKDEQELRFDVRGQRCLKYERIIDLEESLKKELTELKSKGFI